MNHYSTRFYHGHQLSFSSQIQQLTPHCLSLSLRYRVTFNMVAESQDRKNTEVLRTLSHDGISNYVQWNQSIRYALAQDQCIELLLPEFNMEVEGQSFMAVQVRRRMIADCDKADAELAVSLKRMSTSMSINMVSPTPSQSSQAQGPTISPNEQTGEEEEQKVSTQENSNTPDMPSFPGSQPVRNPSPLRSSWRSPLPGC